MKVSAEQIRTERVNWAELSRHALAWEALAECAATPNVFNDPAFAVPAAAALEADEQLQAIIAWSGDTMVGLMPFRRINRWGVPFPVVEVWSHAYAPSCLPLVAKDCAEAATIALFDAVTMDNGLPGIVMLPNLSLDTPFAAALLSVRKPLYVHGGHQRAVARTDLDGDSYLQATIKGSRRKRMRQQISALKRECDVTFERARDTDDVGKSLDVFLQLESSGWKGEAGSALQSVAATSEFTRKAVAALCERGMVQILTMRASGIPIASLIVFMGSGTAWLWKIAYDESYSRHSPGKHVLMETVRLLLNEQPGLFIDSCATPDHPLAELMLGERMAMGDVVVSAGGRAGPAFRTANLLERLRGRARALKHRLKG
ncbi:MAG: GNAT family N-acetyltransferase [Rhodobiaceae bacterium]|nr:GNAT family N-acetyltransferase [Rhodobiaceae bacterium]